MVVIAFELLYMRNIKWVAFAFNLRSQLLGYCFVSRQRWGKVVVEYGLAPCQRCYTLDVQNIRLATTFAFIPVGRRVCALNSYKRRKKLPILSFYLSTWELIFEKFPSTTWYVFALNENSNKKIRAQASDFFFDAKTYHVFVLPQKTNLEVSFSKE